MSKERLAQIEAAFAEAKSVEKERICLAPYEADIEWLLATARAGLEDRERLDALDSLLAREDVSLLCNAHGRGLLTCEDIPELWGDEPGVRSLLDALRIELRANAITTRSGRADTEKA